MPHQNSGIECHGYQNRQTTLQARHKTFLTSETPIYSLRPFYQFLEAFSCKIFFDFQKMDNKNNSGLIFAIDRDTGLKSLMETS